MAQHYMDPEGWTSESSIREQDLTTESFGGGFTGYFDAKELDPMCYWLREIGFSEHTVRELNDLLREPHRFYHGPFHICYLWKLFEERMSDMDEEEQIKMGVTIAFHDAIYKVGYRKEGSNEVASAHYFSRCWRQDQPKSITKEMAAEIMETIKLSDPAKYGEISPGSFAACFVVNYDLHHFVDPDYDLDLANWLIFKEFQHFPFPEYIKGTEAVLGSIPFSPVSEGVARAISWLKAPSRRFSFGVYAGSFNPFHVGHASVLRQAEHLFDKVIILVGSNPAKKDVPPGVRAADLRQLLPYHEVRAWDGLTTDFLTELERETGAQVTLIRGLRTDTDFAAEENNQRWMEDLKPDLKIMYVPCEAQYRHVSSSGLRYLQQFANVTGPAHHRSKALYAQKYKVNTEEHYRLTKSIIARKVLTRI